MASGERRKTKLKNLLMSVDLTCIPPLFTHLASLTGTQKTKSAAAPFVFNPLAILLHWLNNHFSWQVFIYLLHNVFLDLRLFSFRFFNDGFFNFGFIGF